MATRPVDAAHHHRMIDRHARALRDMAGKGGSTASKARPMPSEGTKARADAKGAWPKKK